MEHGATALGLSAETEAALNAALLTIDNYYNGDRVYAERWLLAAYDVNQKYGNG